MSRNSPLSTDELTQASVDLLTECDVDAYGTVVLDVFRRLFSPRQAFYYHFFDGRMSRPVEGAFGYAVSPETIHQRLEELQPFRPGQILARKLKVCHIAEVYALGHELADAHLPDFSKTIEQARADWGVSAVVFDGPVMMMVTGFGQPYECGDVSPFDLQGLRQLYPYIERGFLAACELTRRQRFGPGMAAALEYHPQALFLFDEAGSLHYANHTARQLMQDEEAPGARWPIAANSTIVSALRERLNDGEATLPIAAEARILPLDAMPRQDAGGLRLAVVSTQRLPHDRLTERQWLALCTLAAGFSLEETAQRLAVSPLTLRQHLKNAYRRLEVSGLDEALAVFHQARIEAAPPHAATPSGARLRARQSSRPA